MSRKLNHNYKEPFSKSTYQLGSRENSPPPGGLMDTAMRSSSAARPMDFSPGAATHSIGTATSAQELQGQGALQGKEQVLAHLIQSLLLCLLQSKCSLQAKKLGIEEFSTIGTR